jgi:hypothetical protein
MQQVNLDAMLARFAEHWSPKKIAQVNDYDVRIVKVQGEFTWHQHPDVMKERGLPLPVAVRAFMLGVSTSSTTMGGPKWKRTTARRSWAWTCTGAGRCW